MLQRQDTRQKKRHIEESKDTNHELQVQCWAQCLSTQGEDMAVEEGGVEQEEQHANKGEMGEEAGREGVGQGEKTNDTHKQAFRRPEHDKRHKA